MSGTETYLIPWLVSVVGCFVIFCRGLQIWWEKERLAVEWVKQDDLLSKIRKALELPTSISFDVLPGAISTLFNEHKRIQKKYLDLKTKWQEIESRTGDTKKVFARALKRWQKAHNTEKVPHLNELVDWLVGEDNLLDNLEHSEMLVGLIQQLQLVLGQSQRTAEKLEWIQKQFSKLTCESNKGGKNVP